jgi:DNA (cytosine-5)-methyltransferase 1
MKKLKLFEAFAGYGGATYGLKRAKIPYETVGYSEIDKHAIEFYENNHPGIKNYGDITKINPKHIPDFDLFTGGFPCQPFSQVGLGLGELDTRGTLFYDILRICKYKKPKHILLENVKGLVQKRHKNTLSTIISSLNNIGYDVDVALLNSKHYGIPQNRERVWIYAYLGSLPAFFKINPKQKELKLFFKDFLDKNPKKTLFKTQKQIRRLMELYDGISVTILEPHHNKMRIVHPPKGKDLQVRNYSIEEHFRLMGFKKEKINFGGQSYSQLCKMAANGWDINLTSLIYKNIFEQIDF